jgi:RNase P subunit RPR2
MGTMETVMQIIQRGDPDRPKWWLRQSLRCHHCETLFCLEAKDRVTVREDQRNGAFVEVECPVCGYRVTGHE